MWTRAFALLNSEIVGPGGCWTIAKALEMFLELVVDEASRVSKERGAKRLEPYHLYVVLVHCFLCRHTQFTSFPILCNERKHAIERTDMLDFLKEIVAGVADPSQGGTIDLEAEKEARRKQSKQASRKRKRKAAADDAALGAGRGADGDDEEGRMVPEPDSAGRAWGGGGMTDEEEFSDREWD